MALDLAKLEVAIEHFAAAIGSGLKGVAHLVAVLAPVAAEVADVVGSPEVGVIANEVGQVAKIVDTVDQALPSGNAGLTGSAGTAGQAGSEEKPAVKV